MRIAPLDLSASSGTGLVHLAAEATHRRPRDPAPRQRRLGGRPPGLQGRAAEHPDPRLRNDPPRRERPSTAVRLARATRQCACSRRPDAGTNAVYTILFAFGSTDVKVPSSAASELIEHARQAELIVARGRTDGEVETAAESRIARERAAAVRAYLVQAGIDPARIRTTYQPIGDHAANNSTAAGRALNRRVEIEMYSAPPQVVALNNATRP